MSHFSVSTLLAVPITFNSVAYVLPFVASVRMMDVVKLFEDFDDATVASAEIVG
jgi:hypothetical protein